MILRKLAVPLLLAASLEAGPRVVLGAQHPGEGSASARLELRFPLVPALVADDPALAPDTALARAASERPRHRDSLTLRPGRLEARPGAIDPAATDLSPSDPSALLAALGRELGLDRDLGVDLARGPYLRADDVLTARVSLDVRLVLTWGDERLHVGAGYGLAYSGDGPFAGAAHAPGAGHGAFVRHGPYVGLELTY